MNEPDYIKSYLTYLTQVRCMKERSLQDYIAALKSFTAQIDPFKAECREDVRRAILANKQKFGWSDSTASKHSKCIKNFYDWAASSRLIPFNPYPMNEFKRGRPKRPEFVTPEVFELLINDPFLNHQEQTILWLLWDTGIRIGELVKMNQADIDFKEKVIHVSEEISKGGYSDRYIPFGPECEEALKKQIDWIKAKVFEPCLFINKDWFRVDERDLSAWISAIGIKHTPHREPFRLTAHMFRHGYGVRRLEEGYPEVIVMRHLGHNSAEMLAHYTNMSKKQSRGFFEKYTLKKQFTPAHVIAS